VQEQEDDEECRQPVKLAHVSAHNVAHSQAAGASRAWPSTESRSAAYTKCIL
jgi:hypothetical protein